jgi:hypothetical protein
MSESELVAAYTRGDFSRRTFIRKLVAGGLSLGAAVAYSHALSPEPARATECGGSFYEPADGNAPRVTVALRNFATIEYARTYGIIPVRVTSNEPAQVTMRARREGRTIAEGIAWPNCVRNDQLDLNARGGRLVANREQFRFSIVTTALDQSNGKQRTTVTRGYLLS